MKSNVKWRTWIIIGVVVILFVIHFLVKQADDAAPKSDDNSGLVIR